MPWVHVALTIMGLLALVAIGALSLAVLILPMREVTPGRVIPGRKRRGR